VVNAANVVTAARLVLVPVFVAAVALSGMDHAGWQVVACAVFLVASLTDFVDGWIARRYGLVTAFGKVADPLVDKALVGAALVLLSGYGFVPWWVTGLILAREVGVTLLRLWVIRYGVIAASRGGKIKTALQTAAIAWYLLPLAEPLDRLGPVLLGAAVLVTVVTGLDYALRALRLRVGAAGG
jgi:CDP-diacylglycerol--glycerol-3-phosphate 3-phosphatidyltransferase